MSRESGSRAIILGSGTSTGIPMAGKVYPPEYLAQPKNHRTRSSLLLEGPDGRVLVDAGPDCRLQLTSQGVTDLEAVLITHTHADHIMGMDDLRGICLRKGSGLPVYARPEHQEDIRRIFGYAFLDFPPEIHVPRFDLRDVPDQLRLAGLDLRIFWVDHGATKVMAFRIHDFAYITDVSRIPEEAYPLLEGLDVLVLDAVRFRPHPNHFHLERALEVSARIGAATTYLTHLSDDYDHEASEAALPPGVKLAYDGLAIPLRPLSRN